jgi:hypothetical protein
MWSNPFVSMLRFHDEMTLTVYDAIAGTAEPYRPGAVSRSAGVILAIHQMYVVAACFAIRPAILLWMKEHLVLSVCSYAGLIFPLMTLVERRLLAAITSRIPRSIGDSQEYVRQRRLWCKRTAVYVALAFVSLCLAGIARSG